jgi:hypothetical protein
VRIDDCARVTALHGNFDTAVEYRSRVVAMREVGCHACVRVVELASRFAHGTQRLYCEGAKVVVILKVAVLRQFAF